MTKKKGFDRGRNPHDGSRRRLRSQVHKSPKDYKREKPNKWEFTKELNSGDGREEE